MKLQNLVESIILDKKNKVSEKDMFETIELLVSEKGLREIDSIFKLEELIKKIAKKERSKGVSLGHM
jgi:hypothetical protein